MNKVILLGRLTRDPELKTTPNGVSVCAFGIAVNRRFKNASGEYDADFINCIAWRQTAEFVDKYFAKGRMIGVVGSLQTRTYEKDGQKRYITEVVADEVYFAGDKPSGSAQTETQTGGADMPEGFAPVDWDNADLPF